MSAFRKALAAAESDADVLAAVARGINPDGDPPTPEALAKWWPECPEAVAETESRLAALVRCVAVLEDEPSYKGLAAYIGRIFPTTSGLYYITLDRLPAPVPHGGIGNAFIDDERDHPDGHASELDGLRPRAGGPLRLSRVWMAARKRDRKGCPAFPLAPIVRAWLDRPRDPSRRHLIVTAERYPPKGREPLTLARTPGALQLATLAVVEVDGAPFAVREPDGRRTIKRRARIAEAAQADLFPGPRNLAGQATGGAVLEAVAQLWMTGDERNPLRGDVLRLGNMATSLTGAVKLTHAEGALLVAGRDSDPNRERFNRAAWGLRGLAYEGAPGQWWALADSEPGPLSRIGPVRWWLDYWRIADGLKGTARTAALEKAGFGGAPIGYRLSGGLFRSVSQWGTTGRTVAGIEGALSWRTSAGAGSQGRTPDNLRPVRRGGPGPEVFVPWWQVLRLAGENVGPDTPSRGAPGQRYRDRVAALEKARYMTRRNATALAGDTIEVVEVRRGARNRPAGIVVRASARYCAAYALNVRTRLPASRLLEAPPKNPCPIAKEPLPNRQRTLAQSPRA